MIGLYKGAFGGWAAHTAPSRALCAELQLPGHGAARGVLKAAAQRPQKWSLGVVQNASQECFDAIQSSATGR